MKIRNGVRKIIVYVENEKDLKKIKNKCISNEYSNDAFEFAFYMLLSDLLKDDKYSNVNKEEIIKLVINEMNNNDNLINILFNNLTSLLEKVCNEN